ncbi:hypothetical protein [Paracraurococcus lichenis]|uniref:DUF3422 family protein n=1 Tax=Paracraurococcus lichenis TaxID=3064888 RepID=A0ABT9E016_9PROT|nr:hypothetical protein [Paracraurococcus sp. LOR1-02]MDO9709482.1 hypothetical protein [Paracraurococcus sp. LOR1-02]
MPPGSVNDTQSTPSASADPPGEMTCTLEHPVFRRFPGIGFRRSPLDGEVVMVVPMAEREAVLPLKGIQQEFGIAEDSPDGRMLALVAESLGYVTALHPGDPLPAEVVNGAASWSPEGAHRRRAQVRLRIALLGWQDPEAAQRAMRDIESGGRLDSDPELRTAIQNASRKAVNELGCAGPDEVIACLDRLAEDFAYVEALRDRLLVRVQRLIARAQRIGATLHRSDTVRSDAIRRITRMAETALEELSARFRKLDGVYTEIIPLLREPETRLAFVQENRDALYRTLMGWEPILGEWDGVREGDDLLWQAVGNTYQFLARRYLAVAEWPPFGVLRQALSRGRESAMRW